MRRRSARARVQRRTIAWSGLLGSLSATAVVLALILIPTNDVAQVLAAAATLRVDPAAACIEPGQEFDVRVLQNVDVATTGANTDLEFSAGLLEVVDVKKGAAYPSVLVGIQPQSKTEAIAAANQTGIIENLGAFISPGSASVPAGDAEAFVIRFRARASRSGLSQLAFKQYEVLDTSGGLVPLSVTNGSVRVTGDGATPVPTNTPTMTATPTGTLTPAPTHTPTATPTNPPPCTGATATSTAPATATAVATGTNTPTPAATNTSVSAGCPTPRPTDTAVPSPTGTNTPFLTFTPTASNTPEFNATMKVDPASIDVPPGTDVILKILADAPVETTGVGTDVKFDRSLLEIVSVELGETYTTAGGQLLIGEGGQSPTAAYEESNNCSGIVANLGTFLVAGTGTIATGEHVAFTLKFRAKEDVTGTSNIELLQASLTKEGDENGTSIKVAISNGEVTIDPNAPTPTPTIPATGTATVTSVATVAAAATTVNSVAGSGTSPVSATGLPNAGAWFGEDGTRSLILVISIITLLASLVALANTWIRRRRT